jgi:hypothetical protein
MVSKIIGLPEDVCFEPQWKDPAPKSEKEHAETLVLKKTLGVPRDQILTELDYSDAQIEEFAKMREEEQASIGTSLLNQMARGQLDGTGATPGGNAGGANENNSGSVGGQSNSLSSNASTGAGG